MHEKTTKITDFDELDRKILNLLMENAQMPYTEIAEKVHTSSGTVHVRMRKLESAGVVTGSKLRVDPAMLGYDLCAFLGIFLEKGSLYKKVVKQLEAIPEITELHYTTGNYNILAKLYCRDTRHLRDVLNDKIQTIEGVERTETFISLEPSLERAIRI
ncbi:MAG TPA: Lrp/AsnC ligand binding domain-containing protein [bacterium]|nr:Lrp/AsnC ligand binding domain-containing protein [bacterium]HMZ05446.1 Lrp/AsnC ligand binding domain-containing protein [bacterium]HNB09578.1 Lrp/AsnC ligand binding domain-containing protein [bacterium]HNC47360.1 Lrp/AsnC ligand binding domain-containing protein [bacterium]HND76295.1 Lrp/AsnC ligand binding domain-containing protein [bacterium]